MAIAAQDVVRLPDARDGEDYIYDRRNGLNETLGDWHDAITTAYAAYNGEVTRGFYPNGQPVPDMNVQNLQHDNARDLSSMAAEASPTLICPVVGNRLSDSQDASLRRAIHMTHWKMDRREQKKVRLLLDLILAGGCFALVHANAEMAEYYDEYRYPCSLVLKPLGCYPTFVGDRLTEFIYVDNQRQRALAERYPALMLEKDKLYRAGEMAEVIDYWTPRVYRRVIVLPASKEGKRGSLYMAEARANEIGKIPVAWSMWDSGIPGTFEDILASMAPMVKNANMIFALMMEATIRGVFGGEKRKGVIDGDDNTGLGRIVELDPAVPGADVAPIAPPALPPEAFGIFTSLLESARAAGAFPAQRGGGNLPSIISAAGIQATQGERDTLRGQLQQHIGDVFRQMADLSARLECMVLDEEKPLMVPSGKHRTYVPTKAFDGNYYCDVTYPNGSASPLNREVLNYQGLVNGVMSQRTVMEQSANIPDPDLEFERMYSEMAVKLQVQRFLAGAENAGLAAFNKAMNAGQGAQAAIDAGYAALQAQLPQLGGGQPPTQPGAAGEPLTAGGSAEQQNLQLQKGQVGTEAIPPPQLQFAPPPLGNVVTKTPGGF